jgi:hypothetical protein
MGLGMNGQVQTLAAVRDTLYAGGLFTTADNNATLFIAQWKPNMLTMSSTSMGETDPIALYPNPVQNKLYVRAHGFSSKSSMNFTLLDGPGNVIMHKENVKDEISFDAQSMRPGLYIYKITASDGAVIKQGKIIFGN